ncbi:MAG: tape measure protein [Planctomyces sp.]|nr:tape measure protein [Planctomyces sp.]
MFKAGISAQDLAGKTNQLATVAAATSTDLNDLARIYQQGASTGSFGQDKINQLAERGIDIYHALEAATGRSGAELKGMISDGKIGIAEMDSALAHMTEGHGIYAGSLAAMANTTGGKLAQMKNNISQALGDVMGIALEILHPFGTAMVSFTQSLRDGFTAFRGPIIYASTAVAWFFGNLVTIGKFAWATAQLGAITFFNDIVYFFGTTIPAYLSWFGENWSQVFTDAGNVVMTVFRNMAINIGSAMAAIWDYIASGGTTELQFAFVPLLDGFKATVAELPNIPDRAMTDLERQLTAQTEQLGGQLANNFDAMLADASQKVGEADTQIKDTVGRVQKDGSDTAIAAANKAAENKAIGVRTAEGQTLAAQLLRGQLSKEDRALKAQDEANGHLSDIERHLREGNRNNARGKKF